MIRGLNVPHDNDVRVAANEYVSRYTVNRCIGLLEENDAACEDFYAKVFGGIDISGYERKLGGYGYGKAVWYYDREKVSGRRLWLLLCVEDGNTRDPSAAFFDLNSYGQPDFEKYGWKDLTQRIDMFDDRFGLVSELRMKIGRAVAGHEADPELHPFGELDAKSLDRKILNRDLSNIDPGRESCFFPYQTGHFSTDTIVNGTYRVWDCGLLELDVVFRFGYAGSDSAGHDLISCNNVEFRPSPTENESEAGYQRNGDYFYSPDDMKMFMNTADDAPAESTVGNTRQGNRNGRVNAYFAKLDFPDIVFNGQKARFRDLNYMVFSTAALAQDGNVPLRRMSLGSNAITWCDKTRDSVTAMLITYPVAENMTDFAAAGGLASNSFSCSIMGRWER